MTIRRALICPPTGPGSLGDEAMIEALAARLSAQGLAVDVMTPFADTGSWEHLPGIDRHLTFPEGGPALAITRLVALMRSYERVYVLGADVLDGHYDDRTVRRLLLAASAARLALRPTTIVGFSYNTLPSPTSVRLMRLLPPGTRIFLRDASSLERFRSATGRRAELSADVAFLLEPADVLGIEAAALAGWLWGQREAGREVVAFNAGGASYVPGAGQRDPDEVAATYAAELSALLGRRADVALALIAHDHRQGVGEHTLLQEVHERIDPQAQERVSALISPRLRASEVKRLVADVDLVCTSRMHLAVAALGAGTPVVSVAYQDKFAGLYEHFALRDCLLSLEESLVPGQLETFVSKGLDRAGELRGDIARAASAVERLAEQNLG